MSRDICGWIVMDRLIRYSGTESAENGETKKTGNITEIQTCLECWSCTVADNLEGWNWYPTQMSILCEAEELSIEWCRLELRKVWTGIVGPMGSLHL